MNLWLRIGLACILCLVATGARADEVAPHLVDDTLVEVAEGALHALMLPLDASERARLVGMYVALDPDRVDVLSLPACDDDGDYVVVVSRALLELVQGAAYAAASDRLRGTRLVGAYGALLAQAQRPDAQPLPPPPPPEPSAAPGPQLAELTGAYEASLLTWIVAGELAHARYGDLTCPHPTATRERADDTWTAPERDEALARAPRRMTHGAEADTWATERVLEDGSEAAPVRAFLEVVAAFEEARATGGTWTYATLHPHLRARVKALEEARADWLATRRAATETAARRPGMR